ncbi:hypothetical protein BpHYR1_011368 [Brachionus plicatilis]|uniref:Uncharacterized protein n=1 Tax=Brachionus plicatilis TaxID=10195 RepID=A0A3M7SJ06_BRAPC|nr:hypothetical protein BpHYR1_011368 [Brachionus plicatilis]
MLCKKVLDRKELKEKKRDWGVTPGVTFTLVPLGPSIRSPSLDVLEHIICKSVSVSLFSTTNILEANFYFRHLFKIAFFKIA